jgi:hypothetical protein
MAVNSSYPAGYVDVFQFERINSDLFLYHSPLQHKDYQIHFNEEKWICNCAHARKIAHPQARQCKHEIALTQLWERHQERKSLSMRQAEAAAAAATRRAEQQDQVEMLRAEVAQLSANLQDLRYEMESQAQQQQSANNPDLAAILAELAALKAENAEIKKQLATKATARKKHQTEQEAAEIKEQINSALDDAVQQAENAICAAQMARERLADLESIPHFLKAELDAQAEAGKPELQPDYKTPEFIEPELKSEIRKMQEADRAERKKRAARGQQAKAGEQKKDMLVTNWKRGAT